MAGNIDAAEFAEKLSFAAQLAAVALAQVMQEDDACVVAIGIVLRAWITETYNQFDVIVWHGLGRFREKGWERNRGQDE